MAAPVPYDAVILAGGRAARLGGLSKPDILVGGLSLLERVTAAVAQAGTVIVVGPAAARPAGVTVTREDPPGAGPVPALRAGLAKVTADWLVLVAADLPFLTADHVSALLRAACPDAAGAVLVDDGGQEQWLIGAWRTPVLAAAAREYRGGSLRGLLGPLAPVRLRLPPSRDGRPPWFDCDTRDDLEAARRWAGSEDR